MKKLFFLDFKELDDKVIIDDQFSNVLKVLKRYELGIKDYENNEFTEAIFIRLGWSNKYKDTILSFRTIFCKIIEIFSNNNAIKLPGGGIIKFYFNNNKLEYDIIDGKTKNNIDGKTKPKYSYSKEILYGKFTKAPALQRVKQLIETDKEILKELEIFAGIVDSLSNFTPHPGYPFNQAKGGRLTNVADNLNLMVDKIQKCIDERKDLIYGDGNYNIVKLEVLSRWKEWLIKNQSSYCLNEFYEVEKDKLKGRIFFDNQSLTKPLPQTRDELLEYLKNINRALHNRGEMMYNSFK